MDVIYVTKILPDLCPFIAPFQKYIHIICGPRYLRTFAKVILSVFFQPL